jgi:hypothetical protein
MHKQFTNSIYRLLAAYVLNQNNAFLAETKTYTMFFETNSSGNFRGQSAPNSPAMHVKPIEAEKLGQGCKSPELT